MFQILSETEGALFAVKAIGKLTDEDYQVLIPRMEAAIAAEGAIRIFADLTDFEGWEWQAAYDDFAFGLKHRKEIERMALLGDARWEALAARVMDLLSGAEVKHFVSTDRAAALAWVRR